MDLKVCQWMNRVLYALCILLALWALLDGGGAMYPLLGAALAVLAIQSMIRYKFWRCPKCGAMLSKRGFRCESCGWTPPG